jgi:hypothetical protein
MVITPVGQCFQQSSAGQTARILFLQAPPHYFPGVSIHNKGKKVMLPVYPDSCYIRYPYLFRAIGSVFFKQVGIKPVLVMALGGLNKTPGFGWFEQQSVFF